GTVPEAAGGGVARGRPVRTAALTSGRLELAARLHDGARPAGAQEGAVERLTLAFEELASNALRHGRAPVEVVVTTLADRSWLLTVSDAAGDLPPTPAVGRDAALGGLGLYMVAGQVAQAAAVLSTQVAVVQTQLADAGQVADATNGSPTAFSRFAAANAGSAGVSYSLWRVADGGVWQLAVQGPAPRLPAGGAAAFL